MTDFGGFAFAFVGVAVAANDEGGIDDVDDGVLPLPDTVNPYALENVTRRIKEDENNLITGTIIVLFLLLLVVVVVVVLRYLVVVGGTGTLLLSVEPKVIDRNAK